MRSIKHSGASLGAVIVILVLIVSYQSFALGQAAARPTACATINLERAFDGLQERAAVDARLTKMAEELKAEGDEKADAIDALTEELDMYLPGTERHQRALEEFQLTSLQYQAHIEFSRRKIDLEHALVLRRLYGSIKRAAAQMSAEMGYDLVLVDDSIEEIPAGTETDVRRQIAARRILFGSKEIDITKALIEQMNRDFAP